jgi:hypothetical protein
VTIIAASFENESSYAIASDSQGEVDGERITGIVKVHRWGSVLFGGWGTSAQVQYARRWLLGWDSPADLDALMVSIRSLYDALCERVGPAGNAEVANVGAGFLFVGPWGILCMDYAGAVHDRGSRAAGGSGGLVASGAMWARRQHLGGCEPRLLVDLGVRAAIELDTGCGGDVRVLTGPT